MTAPEKGQEVQVFQETPAGRQGPFPGVVEDVLAGGLLVDVHLTDHGYGLGSIPFCSTGKEPPTGSFCRLPSRREAKREKRREERRRESEANPEDSL